MESPEFRIGNLHSSSQKRMALRRTRDADRVQGLPRRAAMLRFLILQRHDWSEDGAERLAGEVKSPTAAAQDTMIHQIIKELRR